MNKRPLDDRGEDIFAPPEQPLERPRREETEKTREELLDEIYVRLEEDYIAAVTSRDITSDYIPIGTFTLSAHGMQAEIDVRGTNTIKPIIDKIKEDYPAYYAGMIAKENWPNPIINLIENTHVAVVVGPATCSVMMPATDKVCSSSKSDIDMVHQIYTGFYKKNPDIPPNDFIESKLFTIARMNLRENLLNYTASEKDSTQPWLQKFFKDVKKGNIWKHIKIDPEDPNNNKLYQFHKNADEEEEYDCLYGLHLEDLAMKIKDSYYRVFPHENISANLGEGDELKIHLYQYVKELYSDKPETEKLYMLGTYEIIVEKIQNSVESDTDIYTSDLIMLGVILQLDQLYIFDPSCRPVTLVGVDPIGLRSGTEVPRHHVSTAIVEDDVQPTQSVFGEESDSEEDKIQSRQPTFTGYAVLDTDWLGDAGLGGGGGNRFTKKYSQRNKMARRTRKKSGRRTSRRRKRNNPNHRTRTQTRRRRTRTQTRRRRTR